LVHFEAPSGRPHRLLTASTMDKLAGSGHGKARGHQGAEALEKQLHRWVGEGGALLADANSDSEGRHRKRPGSDCRY
jgi:hypothetical protein